MRKSNVPIYKNLKLETLSEYVDGVLYIEEWHEIKGFDGAYQVSSFGRIKSVGRLSKQSKYLSEKIMKQHLSKTGYPRISLAYKGGYKCLFVHILVAKAFVKNPLYKPQVNHMKGIKIDARFHQLEWATRKEDSEHAIRTGLYKQIGEKGYFAKLKNKQVLSIYKSNLPIKALSQKYNVCDATIYQIKNGTRWKQITGAPKTCRRIFNMHELNDILNDNSPQHIIAKKYSVNQKTISRIKTKPDEYKKIATDNIR